MTAKLIMDPNPTVLHHTDTIRTAADQIMTHRFRSMPVVDEAGRYLGVLGVNSLLYLTLPQAVTMEKGLSTVPYMRDTVEDLRARLRKRLEEPVTICLRKDVAVVHPNTALLETLLTLYKTRRSLPVVDKKTGRLEGMISYFDVGAKIMEEGF